MTPGHARVALLSFLLVMVGVATNALFLQSRSTLVGKAAAERTSTRPSTDKAAVRLGEANAAISSRRGALLQSPDKPLEIQLAHFLSAFRRRSDLKTSLSRRRRKSDLTTRRNVSRLGENFQNCHSGH